MTAFGRLCKHGSAAFAAVIAMVLLSACGASIPVRVLPEGTTTANASVGGPIVPSSSPVGFAPYITGGVAHGVSDAVTVHGNVHLLMAAFAVAGADIGASMRVVRESGAVPELTASARILGFVDVAGPAAPRAYPDLALTASWTLDERTFVYAGSHGTFQWKPYAFYASPFLGVQFPVSSALSLQTEFIWQAANVDTHTGIFEGASSIGGTGSFGIFIAGVLTL